MRWLRSARARAALVLLALAAGLALIVGWWLDRARPLPLPDVQARLPCLSYAPFRRPGSTPFDPAAQALPAHIEHDLRLLRPLTDCVRTYSVDQGLDAVPALARSLGMRVKLGAWIGRDRARNRRELQRALQLAREHRDVVELLIVGSEVLLRGELPPASLAELLQQARRESVVPVGYADVWEFWLRHAAELQPHVDVVVAHVLPYWEDEPVAVERAVAHVYSVAARLRARFAPLPVLIGETGWPAAGRQRGDARPGRLEQARFVRELLARAAVEPLQYNVIEAFDQPWKRALEGAMGGAWGLFDRDGRPRFDWHGPVERDPGAWRGLLAAAIGAALGLTLAWRRWRGSAASAAFTLVAAAVASIGVAQADALLTWQRTPLEWAVGALASAVAATCALLAAVATAERLAGRACAATPGIGRALRGPPPGRALGAARAAVLFIAATLLLQLLFDGRYRGFASALLAAPALALFALRLAGDRPAPDAHEERLLAALLALGAPLLIVLEGPHNHQALGFAALLALLAAAAWPRGRTNASAASTAAGAAASAE